MQKSAEPQVEGVCVLRVAEDGTIRSANEAAQTLLGPCEGRPCRDVVAAFDRHRERVCTRTCVGELTHRPGCHRELRGVVVDGRVSRLSCSRVGDEIVVVLNPGRRFASSFPCLLTARERQVLALVADGLTNEEIAQELDIGHSTVRTHLEHLLARLGAASRAEAVSLAMDLGELD